MRLDRTNNAAVRLDGHEAPECLKAPFHLLAGPVLHVGGGEEARQAAREAGGNIASSEFGEDGREAGSAPFRGSERTSLLAVPHHLPNPASARPGMHVRDPQPAERFPS